jgi:hypothetical protein
LVSIPLGTLKEFVSCLPISVKEGLDYGVFPRLLAGGFGKNFLIKLLILPGILKVIL